MKEVDFRDRVANHPGRITLTPVAGKADTYEMQRADEPIEVGTPIDKATFNSIIHSRLTGRFYAPTVARELNSSRELTVSPLPTSGWVFDTNNSNKATNGAYAVETSSNNGSGWQANGAFTSAGWQSSGGTVSWLQIYHSQALKVKKIRFGVDLQYSGRLTKLQIQGSENGTVWNTVGELTSITTGSAIEYTLGAPDEYKYYRLYFTSSDSNRVTVKSLSYTLYEANTYKSTFTVSGELPAVWTNEQRVMIVTPSEINSFGVITNTLNGVTVNTILQPSKRYELRYNGTAFNAKEV